jgi:probable phosphoglycerate mutase
MPATRANKPSFRFFNMSDLIKLHLVRHGQTDWNAAGRLQGSKNSDLTQEGKEQASQLANKLQQYSFQSLISSSSKRAVQTAEILAKKLKLDIEQNDDLREINLGPWEGRFKVEIEKEYPDEFHKFWYQPDQFNLPGAEKFKALQQRGITAISKIIEQNKGKELLIVSHGAMIKSILCHFEGRALEHLWQPPKMSNCAHSIIEFGPNGDHSVRLFAGQHSW